MAGDEPFADEPSEVDPGLAALLADEGLWVEPNQSTEDAIVAAITAESAGATPRRADVVDISTARRRWQTVASGLAAGVAAAVIVLGGFALLTRSGDGAGDGVEVALAATDLAPGSAAVVVVVDTPQGTRLELDVSGLAPAPDDQYYEAWLRQDAEVGVSAGTFHLRGGDGTIELWAGVSIDQYPLITVTIQDEASSESSGRVVLTGLVEAG